MSLYPTKSRLALPQAIADGEVVRHWSIRMESTRDRWDGTRVTARMRELEREGLVVIPPMRLGGNVGVWRLTAS